MAETPATITPYLTVPEPGIYEPFTAEITSAISTVGFEGFAITTPDGEPPAILAVVDKDSRVIDAGYALWRPP